VADYIDYGSLKTYGGSVALTNVHAHVIDPSSLQALRDAYPGAGPEPVTAAAGRNGTETR
jgi:hypothetical protein